MRPKLDRLPPPLTQTSLPPARLPFLFPPIGRSTRRAPTSWWRSSTSATSASKRWQLQGAISSAERGRPGGQAGPRHHGGGSWWGSSSTSATQQVNGKAHFSEESHPAEAGLGIGLEGAGLRVRRPGTPPHGSFWERMHMNLPYLFKNVILVNEAVDEAGLARSVIINTHVCTRIHAYMCTCAQR